HRLFSRTRNPLRRWRTLAELKRLYAQADGFIAVSQGIAQDLTQHLKVSAKNIWVLPNPTVTPELYELAKQEIDNPWLSSDQPPVILAVGGLRQQKDFTTLVRAFAQ